ncbi:putative Cell division control protein 15 (putative) [Rhodotorula toruloides]|nr:putative Cell division control protein 15 (putative) [Rhodotorula toruloides]
MAAALVATSPTTPTASKSRLFGRPSSAKPAESSFSPTSPSFLSRFPVLGTSWAARGTGESAVDSKRERRFSFGIDKPARPGAKPSLQRARSARTSLMAAARKMAGGTRRKEEGEADDTDLRSYRDKAPMFVMSSPELATPGEEKAQWEVQQTSTTTNEAEGPQSPMVKWDPSATNGAKSSFLPLMPVDAHPDVQSHHLYTPRQSSEESSASLEPLDRSTPPLVAPSAFRRARSPKTQWNPPSLPTPPPSSPEPINRSASRSPPVDEETRQAFRAEALAKLTSPTPTQTSFPDDLASFPFPAVEQHVTPPRPTRPPPALPTPDPPTQSSTSLILPLPSARNSLSAVDLVPSPPALVRSYSVGLHPEPVQLDIDFRGRLVRARNSHPAGSSPALTVSSTTSSSPGSSRISDWRPSTGSRKSSDTSVTASAQSCDQPSNEQPSGLYALSSDRRVVESAIDVLAVVEEDEPPFPASPLLRPKRSPTKRGDIDLPHRRPSRGEKRISFDGSLPLQANPDVVVVSRQRHRALAPTPSATKPPLRPFRLSTVDRTFSSGAVVEPTPSEREQLGLSSSTAANSSPSTVGELFTRPLSPARIDRPRAGKRCLSELHTPDSRPVSPASDRDYGVGLGFPSGLVSGMSSVRTRHESLVFSGDEDMSGGEYRQRRVSRRISSGAATRTKLVLREKGKPVLTYQLGECIGRGQFGSVYRALNLNTGQVVAVKRISLEGKSENEVAELSNEVKLLRSLTHPAVVKYEGLVRTEHYLNIILEFAEGGSLEKTIKQYGQLPESLVAAYVLKMLEGLAYLHGEGVVHCDLKAANVLSTKNGNIKLSDFGVSLNLNAIKTTRGLAAANEVNGTPNWMAPEVISMRGATAASDVWSLGATICELVSGRPPYADLVAMSAMFRIVEDDCPPLPDGISAELERFLLRCFRKNPKERPTADELFDDPWLLKHSIILQSRPQDSLPFHRRISSDHRRPLLSLPSALSSTAAFTADMSDSPLPLAPPVLPFALDEVRPRDSLDSGYRAEDEDVAAPPLPAIDPNDLPHPHSFVKITSSKAVDCKICGEPTKRHAVLCKDCGLIAHSRCKEFASTCDLRAQLLAFAAAHSGTSLARFPTLQAVASPPTPASSTPPSFAFADYLPFSKSRRPKLSSPTSTTSRTPPSSRPTSPSRRPLRTISNALMPTKTRSPASTPPPSLGKSRPRPQSTSVSATTTPTQRRTENASAGALESGSAVLPSSTPRVSIDSSSRTNNVAALSPTKSAVEASKKRHLRSVSQPVNVLSKSPGAALSSTKRSECTVM